MPLGRWPSHTFTKRVALAFSARSQGPRRRVGAAIKNEVAADARAHAAAFSTEPSTIAPVNESGRLSRTAVGAPP